MRNRWLLLVALLLSVLCVAASASTPTEQRVFSADDGHIDRPVAIPPEVLKQLGAEQHIKVLMENDHLTGDTSPASWFLASEIHLSRSTHPDLILMGGPPILGANVTTFWIFRGTDHGYEPVLETAALALGVKSSRSRGYCDIHTFAATAVEGTTIRFRFDGKRYVESHERTRPLR